MTVPRIVCVLAGGFLLFTVSRALSLLVVDRSPRPQCQVTPAEVDLGTVSVGQPVERTFLIRNAGTSRLLITDVKSTCQCTVADLPSRAIAPGGLAELKVTFDAKSAGPKSQRVTIQSNDPDAPTHIIKLQAKAVEATQP